MRHARSDPPGVEFESRLPTLQNRSPSRPKRLLISILHCKIMSLIEKIGIAVERPEN
jgi:hypothetical protein